MVNKYHIELKGLTDFKKISEDQSKFKKGKITPELKALTGFKKISKDQSKFKKSKNNGNTNN